MNLSQNEYKIDKKLTPAVQFLEKWIPILNLNYELKQNTAEVLPSSGGLIIATLDYAKENLELSDDSETSKIPPVKARHGLNLPISRSLLPR